MKLPKDKRSVTRRGKRVLKSLTGEGWKLTVAPCCGQQSWGYSWEIHNGPVLLYESDVQGKPRYYASVGYSESSSNIYWTSRKAFADPIKAIQDAFRPALRCVNETSDLFNGVAAKIGFQAEPATLWRCNL